MKVGDVVLSRRILFHDRHIPLGADWEAYALGDYPHPTVLEMEAAAVAEVCAIYEVTMVALKAITDDVERPSLTQFDAHFRLANENLATTLRDLVAYLQRP